MIRFMQTFEQKMTKAVDAFVADIATIRAGRANPAILEKVAVDYYGTMTPITQIANVSVPEARTLIVQPYDGGILSEVEKAIQKADIGIAPNNDGKLIRLNFPPLNEERRREIVKDLKKRSEDAKVTIRAARRDGMEALKTQKKANDITEDDLKNMEKDLQNLTDKKIKEIDDLTAKKEKEIIDV